MVTKSPLESKTVWINAFVFLGMVLSATDVLAIVPKDALGYVAALNAVVNLILRVWFTDTSIASSQSANTPPAGS